jgi:hypothetical protein
MPLTAQETAYIRQMQAQIQSQGATLAALQRGRDPEDEIDAIPGRRIVYTLSGDQSFTIAQLGLRTSPISMLVSQDGPFIMTHYPAFSWYPNAPSTADNLGKWRPVASYPLPAQQGGLSSANAESTLYDMIDISYEIVDGGSGRQFQNLTVGPHLMSTRDSMIKLPQRTKFEPNATIQVFVTFNDIFFGTAPTNDTTGGNLHVDIPGFRIVNLGG